MAEVTPWWLYSSTQEGVMFQVNSIRIATVVGLGVLLVLWAAALAAGQELQAGAAEALEVRVLEVQTPSEPAQGDRHDVFYRMEVISVLRSASGKNPGDTIVVRSYTLSKEAMESGSAGATAPMSLTQGWIGTAYLNADPGGGGPEAGQRFAVAAGGDSFEDRPETPPSFRYTK
jgi:hypothetical protein